MTLYDYTLSNSVMALDGYHAFTSEVSLEICSDHYTDGTWDGLEVLQTIGAGDIVRGSLTSTKQLMKNADQWSFGTVSLPAAEVRFKTAAYDGNVYNLYNYVVFVYYYKYVGAQDGKHGLGINGYYRPFGVFDVLSVKEANGITTLKLGINCPGLVAPNLTYSKALHESPQISASQLSTMINAAGMDYNTCGALYQMTYSYTYNYWDNVATTREIAAAFLAYTQCNAYVYRSWRKYGVSRFTSDTYPYAFRFFSPSWYSYYSSALTIGPSNYIEATWSPISKAYDGVQITFAHIDISNNEATYKTADASTLLDLGQVEHYYPYNPSSATAPTIYAQTLVDNTYVKRIGSAGFVGAQIRCPWYMPMGNKVASLNSLDIGAIVGFTDSDGATRRGIASKIVYNSDCTMDVTLVGSGITQNVNT